MEVAIDYRRVSSRPAAIELETSGGIVTAERLDGFRLLILPSLVLATSSLIDRVRAKCVLGAMCLHQGGNGILCPKYPTGIRVDAWIDTGFTGDLVLPQARSRRSEVLDQSYLAW